MVSEEQSKVIVAVSGGVDSVVLLDLLASQSRAGLIVAHVNHGIRDDSDSDEQFVSELAGRYGLAFTSVRLGLAPAASEETARLARYAWLETQKEKYGAVSIATAHHQDDVLETVVINLIRGTGWRGLASLRSTASRHRPLLTWSKAEVVAYALEHDLTWREDSTNDSLRYLRNRVRVGVIPRMSIEQRAAFIRLYEAQVRVREMIDREVEDLIPGMLSGGALRRYPITMVPDDAAKELLAGWLGESLEQSRLRDALLFIKTARPGAKWSLDGSRYLMMTNEGLIVSSSRD